MSGKNMIEKIYLLYLWEMASYINYIQAVWALVLVKLLRVKQ